MVRKASKTGLPEDEVTPAMIEAAKDVIRQCDPNITDLTPARFLDPMIDGMYKAMVKARFKP